MLLDVDNRQRTAVLVADQQRSSVHVVHGAPFIVTRRVLVVMIPAVRDWCVWIGLCFYGESCRFAEFRTDGCRLYNELRLFYSNTV